MDRPIEIHISEWRKCLEEYRNLETCLKQNIAEQDYLLYNMEMKWKGEAAEAFANKYRSILQYGTYAQYLEHIKSMRDVFEYYEPKIVEVMYLCEQLYYQLEHDFYYEPGRRTMGTYNGGVLRFNPAYERKITDACEEIGYYNGLNYRLANEIMDECAGIIDFNAERELNEKIYRKMTRIQYFKEAFQEFAKLTKQLDEDLTEQLRYIYNRMERYDTVDGTSQRGGTPDYKHAGVPTAMYQGLLLLKSPDLLTEQDKEEIRKIYTNVIEECDLDYLESIDWTTKLVNGIEDLKDECVKFFKGENAAGRILHNAVEQAVLGNFTNNITIEGTVAQVALGLIGVDLPCDVRDLVADVKDIVDGKEIPWYQILGDAVALVPVIGALKYGDEAVTIVKNSNIISTVSKWADEAMDAAGDALTRFKNLWKTEPQYALPGGFSVTETELDGLIKNADEIDIKAAKTSGVGGADVGNIAGKLDTNNIPNMTKQDIIDSIPDDWNYTEHNGFVHIRDADGNIRIRIDPPDKITNYPHVHAYDSDGNLLDSAGNIVDRKSPDGHIPYKDN